MLLGLIEQRQQRWILEPTLWNASVYRDIIDRDEAAERLAELERGGLQGV